MVEVPLIKLCYGRSGDKGDVANIGVIARDPAYYPFLLSVLTEETVQRYFSHVAKGVVRRFEGMARASLAFLIGLFLIASCWEQCPASAGSTLCSPKRLVAVVWPRCTWIARARPTLRCSSPSP